VLKVESGPKLAAAAAHDALVAAYHSQIENVRGSDADYWGALASRFTSDPWRELDQLTSKVASYLRPDDVLVDVGGGAGRNSLPLASRCREVINVDPSAGMGAAFLASAEGAGIRNARFVEGDWLEVEGIEGDILLAAHVTYFAPRILPFIEKLDSAAKRRVIVNVLTVPPPNQMADFFRAVYGRERALVPNSDELMAVLEEKGIAAEVVDLGPSSGRRPPAPTREEAVKGELQMGWLKAEDMERARGVFAENFDELFVETTDGFARRSSMGVRELIITWTTQR